MSLLDTIKGAREEVAQSGSNPFARDKERETADTTDVSAANSGTSSDEGGSSTGFTKRSTARAKPSRMAASSVRVVSSDEYHDSKSEEETKNLTRAERHARADRRRSEEDRRATVARYILNGHAEYKRAQRVWLFLIIGAVVTTLLTWVVGSFIPNDAGRVKLVLAAVLLVGAYGLVIASFIYDWRVVRPMRKAAEEEAERMSDKRIKQYLNARIEAAHEAAERGEGDSGSIGGFFKNLFH